jgi:hypothetical protein
VIQEPEVRVLVPQHHVLGDREHGDQHEVLVHHPDARLDRLAWALEPDGPVVEEDLALVGVVQAEEDVHQGGLASSVLTQEGVNRSLGHLEVDPVVRQDAGEPFGDATELELHPTPGRRSGPGNRSRSVLNCPS